MGALSETVEWIEELYRIETSDPVLGGETGPLNAAAKILGARSRWLKAAILGRTLAEILTVGASAGGAKITNLGAPTNANDAARLADIIAAVAGFTLGVVLANGTSAGGAKITNLGAPTNANDAARLAECTALQSAMTAADSVLTAGVAAASVRSVTAFTTPGAGQWYVPTSALFVASMAVGGGGGGGEGYGSNSTYAAGGGGGGSGYHGFRMWRASDLPGSVPVFVGNGGAVGEDGGHSAFGDLVVYGGRNGFSASSSTAGAGGRGAAGGGGGRSSGATGAVEGAGGVGHMYCNGGDAGGSGGASTVALGLHVAGAAAASSTVDSWGANGAGWGGGGGGNTGGYSGRIGGGGGGGLLMPQLGVPTAGPGTGIGGVVLVWAW